MIQPVVSVQVLDQIIVLPVNSLVICQDQHVLLHALQINMDKLLYQLLHVDIIAKHAQVHAAHAHLFLIVYLVTEVNMLIKVNV